MLVNQWMTRQVLSVGPADPLAVAAERMVRGRVRRLVVEDNGLLIGILARSDVLRAGPAGVNAFSPLGIASDAFRLTLVRHPLTKTVVSAPPATVIYASPR